MASEPLQDRAARHGRLVPADVSPLVPGAAGPRRAREAVLAGDQDLVDDVDDAVGGADVRRGDAGAADAHGLAADADADALAVERLDRAALDDLGRGQLALGDVVEQDRAELRLVLGERVEGRLGTFANAASVGANTV